MTFGEMISKLRTDCGVAIRDENDNAVCECWTNSKGTEPYLDKEVLEWFVPAVSFSKNTFGVCLKLEGEGEEK